jgi:hypothetical protein
LFLFLLIKITITANAGQDFDLIATTDVEVHISQVDYSFQMPISTQTHFELKREIVRLTNPRSPDYIPRMLEIDGVRICIQDVISLKNIDGSVNETSANILVQANMITDDKSIDRDLLKVLWSNYTSSERFSNHLLRNIDNFSVSEKQTTEGDLILVNDQSNQYFSWIFWILVLISILLILLIMTILCCIISKRDKKGKKTNSQHLIVDSMYHDNFNDDSKVKTVNTINSKQTRPSATIYKPEPITKVDTRIEYEDQEMMIDICDDFNHTLNHNNDRHKPVAV